MMSIKLFAYIYLEKGLKVSINSLNTFSKYILYNVQNLQAPFELLLYHERS